MKTFFFLLAIMTLSMASQAFAQSKATLDLFKGIEKNNLNLVKSALKNKGNPNGFNHNDLPTTTVFLKAVSLGRLEIVKHLLIHGADINQQMPMNLVSYKYTGLMLAVKNKDTAIVKLLISRGADVNSESTAGRTALHIGALNNSVEEVKLLLDVPGINVNARPSLCALWVAARQNNIAVERLLLSSSQRSSDPCLERAIEVAELNRNEESVKILVKERDKREEEKRTIQKI
jgi:ankyrin repeat protein